jgi:hypothetical protein
MSFQGKLEKDGVSSIKLFGRNTSATLAGTSAAILVLLRDNTGDILFASGTDVPADATDGYSKGALFIDRNVATGTKALYQNQGTNTSSVFVLIGGVALSAGEQLLQADNAFATATTVNYLRGSTTATSGEHMALRIRAEGEAVGASTAEIRGIYAEAVVNAGLYAGVIQNFCETIAKGASTVTTTRGLRVGVENEVTGGAPTMTNVYGLHVIAKLQTAPATDYMAVMIENEKIGTGVAHDAMIYLKSTTWTGGETIATDVISTAALTGTVTNIINYSTVTATSFMYSDATITNFLETSADSKGGAGATRATPNQTAVCDGSIVVKIGSKTLLIPLYNAVTIA